jgi:hypothetical protein
MCIISFTGSEHAASLEPPSMTRPARKTLSANAKALNAARSVVRGLKFGTTEWETAMVTVRRLVQIVDLESGLHLENYTSIDGDIFDRKAA